MVISAQTELKGRVTDSESGLPVYDASIQFQSNSSVFSITDSTGSFTVTVSALPCTLVIRHLSYELLLYPVTSDSVLPLQPVLVPASQAISEVKVTAPVNTSRDNELQKISLRSGDIEKMTIGFGEADIVRSLQALPGISKSSEVNASLNVRGTGHGNNRISFDGQDLYNSYHLLGIAPMFNPDIVESTILQKSGFNAGLGNALSSFLQVESRKPDMYGERYSASLCNLSAKMLYEGPLVEGRLSLLASARYSFFDMVSDIYEHLHGDKEGFIPLPEYHLYDLFLKLHLEMKNDWKADLTLFNTSDRFTYNIESLDLKTDWKNSLVSFNMTKTIDLTDLIRIHSGISSYDFDGSYNPSWTIMRQNDLVSWDNLVAYSHRPQEGIAWDAGFFSTAGYYYIKSSEKYMSGTLRSLSTVDYTMLSGIYGNMRIPVTGAVELEGGMRISHFYHETGMLRLSPRFQISAAAGFLDLNISYDRTWQFSHLISPLGFNMPADLWYPAGANIPPQRSDQLALHLHRDWWSVLVTDIGLFYKELGGLGELATGTEMIAFSPEEALVFGTGSSYGFEAAVKAHLSFLDAGLYYTRSYSRRYFEQINGGEPFSPPYDLPHQVDIDLTGTVGHSWSWTLTWFWASGQVTTMPTGYAFLTHGSEAMPYPVYTERYNFRMPPAHRMDLSLMYTVKKKRRETKLAFGVYNIYHNSNPYYLYFTIEELAEGGMEVIPRKMSIFPFTPFASIKITFE